MSIGKAYFMTLLLVAGMAQAGWAASDEDVGALKKQVAELQSKVAELEGRLAPQADPAALPVFYDAWDPVAEMQALQREMNALMGAQAGRYPRLGIQPLAASFNPDYDLKENEKAYIISFDMPGMDKSKISVEVREGALYVSGERASESQESKGNKFYRQERSFGYFSRVIPLPKNAKTDAVQAKYDNGVLTLTVDKKETPKIKADEKKKIEVK